VPYAIGLPHLPGRAKSETLSETWWETDMDVNRKELSAIKDVIKQNPRGMTVTEISKSVNLNRHSVAKYLEVLVTAGHIDMKSFGTAKMYYLSQRVPISAMLSLSSDLIITLGNDMRARNVNDRFIEFMGLNREYVLNNNIQKFSYPSHMDPTIEPYIKAGLEGKEGSVEVFYKNGADGYYFVMKSIPTVFEDGNNGVTLILSDITKRVKAEEALLKERNELEIRVKERTMELESANQALKAEIEQRIHSENSLRESEEKYRNLAENISDVPWEIDREGRFTYISPKIKEIMGYEPSDFIGKTIVGFLSPTHDQDILKNLDHFFGKPDSYNLQDTYVLHKDGHEVIVEANGIVLYDVQGNFRGYRGVIRDVTARIIAENTLRKSEYKFRRMVENINDWIWETDNTGRFVYSSPRVYDMLGYRPGEIIGKRPFDLMMPENGEKMYHKMMNMALKGESFKAVESEHIHKDGHTVFVEVSGKPVYDKQGTIVGYTGIARDITERKITKK
jgi:PAS domain S-box-containing protein